MSGSFAPLVQHQAPTLIDRVNLYLGGRLIDRLRIVQGPLTQTARPAPKPRPRPLSAADEVALRDMVADVADDRLRNDLLRLGRAIMMRSTQGSGHK